MRKDRAHLSALPTLHTPLPRSAPSLRPRRPSVLPSIARAGTPIFYGLTLVLIVLWLLVLTWMFRALPA